ncbi:aldo/keto reductase [Microdochium trichocladiopsis]|uniref:Aldo/keto reductase n=1 Tax=Microdochium trichocladiopsis TaxID=1682393 RepID=A0A9P8Y699_9PEZI|nr:aldo/keto reductase [Microdochium trichocladiopsis]KAH7028926.1 aldo/keto reductase [Microdochium trichocladiopsis]
MTKSLRFADGVEVPVPGFGAMGINCAMGKNLSYEEAEPVLLKALELGATFWDTAVSYAAGVNEKILGDFIKKHNCRDKIFIASKCGIAAFEDGSCTNSASHIETYIEGTIERLGFAPDLYYLHRIDPNTPLEESIPALDSLRKQGKTKYIGLSECSAATLRKANSIAKIDAVQAEYSAFETLHETDGLIDTARELDVAFVAYGPLGHGWLVDDFPYETPDDFAPDDYRRQIPKFQGENFYANKRISEGFRVLAERKKCKLPQVALAWVASQGIIALPGTTNPERLVDNWASREIELTEDDLEFMRKIVDILKPQGDRYNEEAMVNIGN